MSVILCYVSTTVPQPLLGATEVSWPPTFQKSGVSNWVPCLWKAVDLWEGACMEPSVNFQNVAGFETAATSSHHKSLECFLVMGSRNDLSSLVSGTSISFLYLCPASLTWNETYHSALLLSHLNFHVFNICQSFTFNDMTRAPRNYI